MKVSLLFMKRQFEPLAKSRLIILAAESVAVAGIHNKIIGLETTKLIKSNKEMEDIVKMLKSFEDSKLLIKGVTETFENETKNKGMDFLVFY